MKKILLLTAALLVTGTTGALADRPAKWEYKQSYDWCEAKARRLHEFEHRAARDGHISRDERHVIQELERDLAASCGGGRWHPDRGWHSR